MKTIIFFLFLLALPVIAQVETSLGQNASGSLPFFYYDVLNYRSDKDDMTRVDVYVEVPYEGIQFVKTDKGFTANYTITVSFYNEAKDKLITEKSWNESVSSRNFETTTSRHNFYLSVRSFNLSPMKYSVRCEVHDQDSKKNFVRQDIVTIRKLSAPIDVSDLMLVSKQLKVDGDDKIIPNISRNIASQKEGLQLFYEIYSDSNQNATVDYIVIDDKNKVIYNQTEKLKLNNGSNQTNFTLSNAELNMGEYSVAVQVKDSNSNMLASVDKKFFSRWIGIPGSVKDLDKAVEQMIYIAKDSEIDHITEAKDQQEQLDRYLEYWKAKDPTPNTDENEVFEEYYRRIQYSNEHFKHYQEGWRTDMGMIYITLGPPNNVERHPFEFDSKPYEIWDYYEINKRFIFVDQTGFGDYRLISPVYGNWWRYRP